MRSTACADSGGSNRPLHTCIVPVWGMPQLRRESFRSSNQSDGVLTVRKTWSASFHSTHAHWKSKVARSTSSRFVDAIPKAALKFRQTSRLAYTGCRHLCSRDGVSSSSEVGVQSSTQSDFTVRMCSCALPGTKIPVHAASTASLGCSRLSRYGPHHGPGTRVISYECPLESFLRTCQRTAMQCLVTRGLRCQGLAAARAGLESLSLRSQTPTIPARLAVMHAPIPRRFKTTDSSASDASLLASKATKGVAEFVYSTPPGIYRTLGIGTAAQLACCCGLSTALLLADNVTLPALLSAEGAMLPTQCVLQLHFAPLHHPAPLHASLCDEQLGPLRRQAQILAFGLTAWGLLIVLRVRAFVERQVLIVTRRRSEAR